MGFISRLFGFKNEKEKSVELHNPEDWAESSKVSNLAFGKRFRKKIKIPPSLQKN